jgi:HAE1 family hydrophobic/amphiphilic exporter-1
MFMLVIMMLGIVSLFSLELDILPEINPPVMAVITELHGASANEVLSLVTEPVEVVSATVSGIKELRSISREGYSLVILEFNWDVQMSDVRSELAEKLEVLTLPEDAGRPQITRFDPSQLPLMQIFATSAELSLDEISAQLSEEIRPRLEAVPGVAAVSVVGGIVREIRVELAAADLYRYEIGFSRVAGLVGAGTVSMPLGSIMDDGREKTLRLPLRVASLADINGVAVGFSPVEGGGIREVIVGDLGKVADAQVAGTSITRLNASPAVGMQIQKEGSSNTVAVAREVHRELEQIKNDFPEMFVAVALDQGVFIEESLHSSARSLVIGGFFAMFVLLGFLGSLLSTLIVAVAIPFSVLATFVLLFLMGMTLNVMTLGGLALGVGMFVDNSIVVLENIFRYLQGGMEPDKAAAEGTGEVAGAIISSTLTTVVVFLPVVFVGGFTGTIFRELAITVTFSLLSSLVVSLTVIPMLAARWLKHFEEEDWRKRFRTKKPLTSEILMFALSRKGLILGLAALLLLVSLAQIPRIGTEFLPAVDEGLFSVDLRLPVGTPLTETKGRVERLERQLLGFADVGQVTTLIGSGAGFSGSRAAVRGAAGSTAQLIVSLKEESPPTLDVMQEARSVIHLKRQDDEEIVFNLYTSLFFSPGSSANLLQLTVSGSDLDQLRHYSSELAALMVEVPGLTGIQSSLDARLPELHLEVDDAAALRAGLSSVAIGEGVRRSVSGQLVGRVRQEQDVRNIRVIMQGEDLSSRESLLNLPMEAGGGLIPLSQVADVFDRFGPATIIREGQRQSVELTGQIEGRDIGSVLSDALKRAEKLDLPAGFELRAVGTALLMEEGFAALRTALLLSLFLIYMVMAAQFESLKAPLVILFTAPLAAIGVVAALITTGTALGITAYIGVIMLGGIVVNNGIVLVDFIERTRRQGMGLHAAIIFSVRHRIRPVLMTAFTTILGLLPLAAQLGDGTELQAPLARVVIGGLLSATILTLVIIPVLYAAIHQRSVRAVSGTE